MAVAPGGAHADALGQALEAASQRLALATRLALDCPLSCCREETLAQVEQQLLDVRLGWQSIALTGVINVTFPDEKYILTNVSAGITIDALEWPAHTQGRRSPSAAARRLTRPGRRGRRSPWRHHRRSRFRLPSCRRPTRECRARGW